MASSLNISFFLWWPFAWWISKMVLTLSESISGFFASICAYFSFSSVGENFVLMVKEPVISKFLVQHLFVCFSFFSCKIWTVIPVLPASHNCCKNYMICNVGKITMNYFKGGGREEMKNRKLNYCCNTKCQHCLFKPGCLVSFILLFLLHLTCNMQKILTASLLKYIRNHILSTPHSPRDIQFSHVIISLS